MRSRKAILVVAILAVCVVVITLSVLVVPWMLRPTPLSQQLDAAIVDSKGSNYLLIGNLTKLIQQHPDFADAYILRAKIYRQITNFPACLADCDKAEQLDPRRPDPHFIRGAALLDMQKPQEAVTACEKALTLDSKSWAAHLLRGRARHSLQKYKDAISDFDLALSEQPQDPGEVLVDRGCARLFDHDLTGALADADQALEYSVSEDALTLHASVLFSQGQHGRAEAELADYGIHTVTWRGEQLPFVPHMSRPIERGFSRGKEPVAQATLLVRNNGLAQTVELGTNIKDVRFAAISPDGQTAIVTCGDIDWLGHRPGGSASLYKLPGGTLKTALSGHQETVGCASFSQIAPLVATGSWDGTVRFWNVADGSAAAVMNCHSPVESVKFSPTAALLAAGCRDGKVRLWDVKSQSIVHESSLMQTPIHSLAWSPSGDRLLVGGGNGRGGTLLVWKPGASSAAQTVGGLEGNILAVAWSPDGKSIAASAAQRLGVWDANSLKLQWEAAKHATTVSSLCFTADSSGLGSAALHDNFVYLWNTADGHLKSTLQQRPLEQWESVQFAADGKWLITAGSDRVTVWSNSPDSANWSPDPAPPRKSLDVQEIRAHAQAVAGVAMDPGGKWFATSSADRSVRIWDMATLKPLQTLGVGGKVYGHLAVSPDGKILAAARSDRIDRTRETTIDLWETAGWSHVAELAGRRNWTSGLRFSQGGKWLVVSYSNWKTDSERESETVLWDIARKSIVQRLSLPAGNFSWFDTDPSDQHLVFSWGDVVVLYDIAADKEVRRFAFPEGNATHVRIPHSGESVVVVSQDGLLRAWNLHTGNLLCRLRPSGGSIESLEMSPDGNSAACADWNGKITLVDIPVRKVSDVLHGHEDRATGVAFAPDGKGLISTGIDGTARVWNLPAPRHVVPWPELARYQYPGKINDFCISPDGKRVALGGTARKIVVWNLSPGSARLQWTAPADTDIQQLTFLRGGKQLLSSENPEWDKSLPAALRLLDVDAQKTEFVFPIPAGLLHSTSVSADESLMATAHWTATLEARLWDLAGRKELQRVDWQPNSERVAFTPLGRELLISYGRDTWAWNLPDNNQLASRAPAACAWKLEGLQLGMPSGLFSPGGELFFGPVTYQEGVVADWKTHRVRFRVHGQFGAFSSDGRLLATSGGHDNGYAFRNQVSLWDTASGKLLGTLRGAHGLTITRLAFIDQDQWILSANTDGTFHFWPVPGRGAAK